MMRARSFLPLLAAALALLGLLWLGNQHPAPQADLPFHFDPPSGSYPDGLTVQIIPAHRGAPILYTFDGTIPTATVGLPYQRPLSIHPTGPTVVILRAREIGTQPHTAIYLTGWRPSLPVLVLAADPTELWGEDGFLSHPNHDRELPVHLVLSEGEGPAVLETELGLRLTNTTPKPDFRLYLRARYGKPRLESDLWPQGGFYNPKRLQLDGGGPEGRLTLLDEALVIETATAMGLPTARGHLLLLFIDRQPFGLYLLRDRLDRHYLEAHLGMQRADLIADGKAREGNSEAWERMMARVAAMDPQAGETYSHLEAQLDLNGLMDAILLWQKLHHGQILALRPRREGARWQWLIEPKGTMEADDAILELHNRLMTVPAYKEAFTTHAATQRQNVLAPKRLVTSYHALAEKIAPDLAWETHCWPFPSAVEMDARAAWEAGIAARVAELWGTFPHAEVRSTLTPRPTPTKNSAPPPNAAIINEYWIDDDGTPYATLGGRGILGDWIEIRTTRPHLDLRGWRLTDNDRLAATDEGSLIFPSLPVLRDLPQGTIILIIAEENLTNTVTFPEDDLNLDDGRLVFYVGNGHLDRNTDPGFDLEPRDEAIALLAPRPDAGFGHESGVDFVAEREHVTPASFGIALDGVRFTHPFHGLGQDDGVIFIGEGNNDDGHTSWIVDPASELSGDQGSSMALNILTPGAPNEGQEAVQAQKRWTGWLIAAVLLLTTAAHLRRRRL